MRWKAMIFDRDGTLFDSLPVSGMRELLEKLRSHSVKLALFTGGGLDSTKLALQRQDISRLFDALITGDDVARHKPDPEGILKAIEILRVNSANTLVVGDAGADVIAGQKAGAGTVLARWSPRNLPYDLPSLPDYTFYSVKDFKKFLFDEEEK